MTLPDLVAVYVRVLAAILPLEDVQLGVRALVARDAEARWYRDEEES